MGDTCIHTRTHMCMYTAQHQILIHKHNIRGKLNATSFALSVIRDIAISRAKANFEATITFDVNFTLCPMQMAMHMERCTKRKRVTIRETIVCFPPFLFLLLL